MTPEHRSVAIVGGGPAGCAAAVFTARYGLDTVVLDRGPSSLSKCAYLENYLGFPAGIDVEEFYGLAHAHVRAAGATLVPDMVEAVHRDDDDDDGGGGFRLERQEGDALAADRVVAATRYDDGYLRPLDDGVLFDSGECEAGADADDEEFDRSVVGPDGATPVDGLFVASPSEAADRQAILAAGRGARVGLAVVEATRRERGYPEPVVSHHDWVRRETTLEEPWTDRDRWREWFDDRCSGAAGGCAERLQDAERLETLREREIDRRLDAYVSDAEIAERRRAGHEVLVQQLDDDVVLERAAEIESDRGSAGGRGARPEVRD